ncbi:GumC family protein [Devosia sp.]|uniref:GumC family protein n=1 Tax=Devosia sp. TaxID=1871048 RepID=UPI003BABF59B
MILAEERAEDLRMDIGALLGAVLSRWLRIFLVTAALLVGVAGLLMFVPRVYESSASLLVEPRDNVYTRAANESAATDNGVNADALMSSQIELIKSRDLLLDVVESEKLRSVPEFASAGFSLTGFAMNLVGRRSSQSIDEIVLANLADRMTVIRERDSSVISVYVRSTDRELAPRIANAIAAAHVKRRAAQSITDTAEATVWLQQEIEKLRTKVNTAETAVANFKVDNDLFMGASATPVTDQQLSTVSTQIAEAQQRKNAAQARADLINSLIASGKSIESVADVRDSVVIQSLLQTKGSLQSELAQKSTTLLANHPTIKALKAQIREIDGQIADQGRRVAASLSAEAQAEDGLEQKLREDLTRAKLASSDATRGNVTLEGLEREAKAQRDLLENYLAKYSDAASRSASNSALPDVRVISDAAPSIEPASPKVPLILGAVGFVALALQVGMVLFGELMSGRALTSRYEAEVDAEVDVHTVAEPGESEAEDVIEEASAPLMAETPAEMQHIAPAVPVVPSEFEDVIADVVSGSLRIVLLAGLGPQDARLGASVELIDAAIGAGLSAVAVDAGTARVTLDPGLSDLSAERADYGDVVQRIDDVLGEVKWGRLAAIDRRSARPKLLIEALADIYHLVVVDTGALGKDSSLSLFASSSAAVLLISDTSVSPVVSAAARRELTAQGLAVRAILTVPDRSANVA